MAISMGQLAAIACLWEATARKPGNVHRTANLPRLEYVDFLLSATALCEPLNQAVNKPVGQTVLQAIRATHAVVSPNTNLGMVLLLAPLATVKDQADSVANVLAQLTVADSEAVYEAIRLAQPGGMGTAPEQDLSVPPTLPLREIMA